MKAKSCICCKVKAENEEKTTEKVTQQMVWVCVYSSLLRFELP